MEKTKEFAVTFSHTVQIGPNDWEVTYPILKVTPATTVAEIEAWVKMQTKMNSIAVRLSTLETF